MGQFYWMVVLLLFLGTVCVLYNSTTIPYYIHKGNANSLPNPLHHFVGREKELSDIIQLLDFQTSELQIVNIYGSPGFGKSTLAKQVGHRMLEKGVTVHYINLDDCPSKGVQFFMAEKIIESSSSHSSKKVVFDKLIQWAKTRYFNNLIILDNCDKVLHNEKEELQHAITRVVEKSALKFLMTSRETTLHVDKFWQYKLYELSTQAACELLQLELPTGINITAREKEELARLTGNVPLALKITVSLLHLPHLPSPESLIAELNKNLISALSPEQLQEDMRINASFSLSYKYLTTKERRVGQLLSNFPGSFTLEACIATFEGFYPNKSTIWIDNHFHDVLNTLLQRSLLEISGNKRYQFHNLVREYFLEKQKLSHDQKIAEKFTPKYQAYFFGLLSNASESYHTHQFRKSFATVGSERHNFLQLFESLKTGNIKCDEKIVLATIADAVDTGLLSSIFSDQDLLLQIESSVSYFKYKEVSLKNAESYLTLIYHLINLKNKVNSPEMAMDVFNHYKWTIKVYQYHSVNIYPQILIKVSTLCSTLGRHDEAKQYYSAAIKHLETNLLEKCFNRKDCSYYKLGVHQKLVKNYAKAIHFFTLSLATEDNNPLDKLRIMLNLDEIYVAMYDYAQQSALVEEIVALLPEIIEMPHHNIFHAMKLLTSALSLLQNKPNEANMLEDCVLDILMSGAVNLVHLRNSLLTVDVLYNNGKYEKAVKLGTYTLKHFSRSSNSAYGHSDIKILAFIGVAKFHSGSFSQGQDNMEDVVDSILQLSDSEYKESDLTETYWTCCFYLIPRLRYIHVCFGQHLFSFIYIIIKWVIYITFVQPFDVFPTNNSGVNLYDFLFPMDHAHSMLSLSKEVTAVNHHLAIMLTKTYEDNVMPLLKDSWSSVSKYLFITVDFVLYFLSFPSVRFCINFTSVLIRIDLLLCITLNILAIPMVIIFAAVIEFDNNIGMFKLTKSFFPLIRLYYSLLFSTSTNVTESIFLVAVRIVRFWIIFFKYFVKFYFNYLEMNVHIYNQISKVIQYFIKY